MQSPIQLLSRKFINIKLEAQPTEQGTDHSFEVSHLITVLQSEEDPTQWNTKFGVRMKTSQTKKQLNIQEKSLLQVISPLMQSFPKKKQSKWFISTLGQCSTEPSVSSSPPLLHKVSTENSSYLPLMPEASFPRPQIKKSLRHSPHTKAHG